MKYPNDWHLLKRNDVLQALSVDMYKGLSEKEIRRRRRSAGANTIWHVPRASAWEVALSAIFDLATLLLVISAAAAAFFDKSTEASALVFVLLIGGVLRTVTYIHANRILENRAREKIPTTSVIREGRIHLILADEVVPGDIILLEQGDTVPADGRVIAGDDSVVSERGITENKTPVHKFDNVIEARESGGEVPCEFRSNMLFAGSLILSGSIRMVATTCGEAALISRKQGGIQLEAVEKLPVIEELRSRSKTTSLVMLACVLLLTALSLFSGKSTSLQDVFLGTMSMAVAAMSEFLTIIGTIMIAVAVRDAAEGTTDKTESRAVIRQPEKLGTLRNMRRIVFCGSSFFKSGCSELYAFRAGGIYSAFSKEKNNASLRELLKLALSASAETMTGISSGTTSVNRSSEIERTVLRAVESYTRKSGEQLDVSYALYDHKSSIDPQAMRMEISLIDKDSDVWAVGVGAVEDVLRCCTTVETNEGIMPISEEMRREIFTECAKLAFSGASIVAVAMRKSPYLQLNRLAVLTQYMTFVGFFAVAEAPEKNAAQNIRYLKNMGITPVLFTEEDRDLYYCHRIGLFNKKTVRVRADQLTEELIDTVNTDGMIVSFEDVGKNHLAAAYAKAMKCIMNNHAANADRLLTEEENAAPITAAVGRETWDSGVLAYADVGIVTARSNMRTVPETLARNACVLVHKENNRSAEAGFGGLEGVVRAIRASRRVFANIASAKSYLTSSQTARLIVLLAALLVDIPLLSAVFILIWGLLFDFAAVLMMSFEATDDDKPSSANDEKHREIASVFIGVLWGSTLAIWIRLLRLIAKPLGFTLTAWEEMAILSASVVVVGMLCAFLCISSARRTERRKLHTAGVLFALASVLLAVSLVTTENSVIGGSFCGWKAVLALVPAAVLGGCIQLAKVARKLCASLHQRHSANREATDENTDEENNI